MKTQIRSSVFETNSSSAHTLVIENKSVQRDKVAGIHLVFGKKIDWQNDKRDSSYYMQERLNKLYENIIYDAENCGGSFLESYKKFKKDLQYISDTLAKYDITCEFIEDQYDYIWDGNPAYEHIFDSDENLLQFIFNDYSELSEVDRDYYWEHADTYFDKKNKNWIEF